MKHHAIGGAACPNGCGGRLAYQFEGAGGDVYACPVCTGDGPVDLGGHRPARGVFVHQVSRKTGRCGLRRLWRRKGPFVRACFKEGGG